MRSLFSVLMLTLATFGLLGPSVSQASACAELYPFTWEIVLDGIEETSSAGQPAWNVFLSVAVSGEPPPGELV